VRNKAIVVVRKITRTLGNRSTARSEAGCGPPGRSRRSPAPSRDMISASHVNDSRIAVLVPNGIWESAGR
jgi:hypothetical protein